MRDCERFRPELSARLDGAGDPELRSELDAHLARCRSCAAALDGMRRIDAALHDLPPIPASPGFEARLRAKLDRAEPTPRPLGDRLREWLHVGRILAWSAVPVVVVALGLFVGRGTPPLPEEDWELVADADTFELMLSDDIELVYALDELEALEGPLEDI